MLGNVPERDGFDIPIHVSEDPCPHHLLPIPTWVYFDTIPAFTVLMGFAFFFQFWRFIRMLPPKVT